MNQINIKYNVGDKINRTIKSFATVSHSGSSTEEVLRIQKIIIERGNSFNGWKPTVYYECQDEQTGDFVTLNDDEINECSTAHLSNNNQLSEMIKYIVIRTTSNGNIDTLGITNDPDEAMKIMHADFKRIFLMDYTKDDFTQKNHYGTTRSWELDDHKGRLNTEECDFYWKIIEIK